MSPASPCKVEASHQFDLLILGGGLAGLCLAYLIRQRHPHLRLKILEQSQVFTAHCTWSFHQIDLADIEPWRQFITSSWSRYEVRFSKLQEVSLQYHSIKSSHFFSQMQKHLGEQIAFDTKVLNIVGNQVFTSSGATFTAPLIIDSRPQASESDFKPRSEVGASLPRRILEWQNRGWGFQKFYGQEVRLCSAHNLTHPILMDATVEQKDGYRFIYVLPLSSTDLLIEDTYYSLNPLLDHQLCQQKIAEYARSFSWNIQSVQREESGCLPIPTSTARTNKIPNVSSSDFFTGTIGMTAGFFHPVTGYSLPWAVRVAEALSSIPQLSPTTVASAFEKLNHEFDPAPGTTTPTQVSSPESKTTTTTQTTILKVSVEGLKSGEGAVVLTVFDKVHAKEFPVKPEVSVFQKYQALAGQVKTDILVPALPEGEYAVFVYHDENSDHKINTNLIGIPTEGYAASQGATNRFGPPKFNDAQFSISGPQASEKAISIKMQY